MAGCEQRTPGAHLRPAAHLQQHAPGGARARVDGVAVDRPAVPGREGLSAGGRDRLADRGRRPSCRVDLDERVAGRADQPCGCGGGTRAP